MINYDERLSLLSDLISMAQADGVVRKTEYDFLMAVAIQLGASEDEVRSLFEKTVARVIPKTRTERISHFHRLALMLVVDEVQSKSEIGLLQVLGLGLKLKPSEIERVISEMSNYPNMMLPSHIMASIFGEDNIL